MNKNVIAVSRGGEKFVFIYDDECVESLRAVVERAAKWINDDDIPFGMEEFESVCERVSHLWENPDAGEEAVEDA